MLSLLLGRGKKVRTRFMLPVGDPLKDSKSSEEREKKKVKTG